MRIKITSSGFTLIELLFVISIIGLLSSIVLASLQSARQRAMTARVVSDFRQMETSFRLLMSFSGKTTWWQSSEFSPPCDGWQTPISCIIENFDLDFPEEPETLIGTGYTYHNSGNGYVCGHNEVWRGVNISLREIPIESGFVQNVDKMIDSGDGDKCGKIRWNQSGPAQEYSLYWMISENSQSF